MFKTSLCRALVALILIPGAASAWDYYPDKPLVFMYQTNSGKYAGCGPTQCTSSSYSDYNNAFGKVDGSSYGSYKKIGTTNKCAFFQPRNNVQTESWDHSAAWVIARARDKCYN